jgi:hypothetical protein
MIKRSVVIAALFSSALEADELPEMPSALKDLKWTADFAALIALRCEGFSLSPSGETANVPHGLFRDLCGWTGFRLCAAPTRCCGVG